MYGLDKGHSQDNCQGAPHPRVQQLSPALDEFIWKQIQGRK